VGVFIRWKGGRWQGGRFLAGLSDTEERVIRPIRVSAAFHPYDEYAVVHVLRYGLSCHPAGLVFAKVKAFFRHRRQRITFDGVEQGIEHGGVELAFGEYVRIFHIRVEGWKGGRWQGGRFAIGKT